MYLASQEVFLAIWEDGSVWAGYHHKCDHPDAVVSPWVNNERRVTFSTPLKAPAFIKKLVGWCCLLPTDNVLRQMHFLHYSGDMYNMLQAWKF